MPGRTGCLVLLLAAAATALQGADAPAIFREGFESPRMSWRQEDSDLTVRLIDHDRTDRVKHDGERSEHFRFTAQGAGSAVYYSLAMPKVPVVADLEVGLYARSNQPGAQLLARVILPADRDPDTGQPSFVTVAGTLIQEPDRWNRLEITDFPRAIEEQARILRVQTKRKVVTEGAYLERLIVNLYGGSGDNEIYLDDLTISPVPDRLIAALTAPEANADAATATPTPAPGSDSPAPLPGADATPATTAPAPRRIKLEAGRLTRDGHPWAPSILDAPGADMAIALPFRVDVLAIDHDVEADRLRAAAERGALFMPRLHGGPAVADPIAALQVAANFPVAGSVAFWELGDDLASGNDPEARKAELKRTRAIVSGLRQGAAAAARLSTAVLDGDFANYARPGQNLDLIGVEARSWGFARDPVEMLQYLSQRRQLSALQSINAPHWAWVTVAAPRVFQSAIWGTDVPPPWGRPRVQPEQVRLGAFAALMAGYKGIGFRADADLTRPVGRALLDEIGLLNAELDLVEPMIARGGDPIAILPGYRPDPKVAIQFNSNFSRGLNSTRAPSKPAAEVPPHESIRVASIASPDAKGRLLLIADLAAGSQWQPPQMALHDLKVRVPGAPDSSQPFEITLGGGRWLDRGGHKAGGVEFTLPQFDTTAIVLLTTDLSQGERLKQSIQVLRPWAVDLAIKQARLQLEWVSEVHGRLENDGVRITEARPWLELAREALQSAADAQAREDYQLAWDEAKSARRPLRLLMRAHWDKAYGALVQATNDQLREADASSGGRTPPRIVPPVASPPLLAFNTLPKHHVWCSWVGSGTFGESILNTGTFDDLTPERLAEEGWTDASYRESRLNATVRLEPTTGASSSANPRMLKLAVAPADPKAADRVTAFLDHPAAAVRTPPMDLKAHQLVRIRVLVRLPQRTAPGAGGLIIRDSLGGESLEYRSTAAIPTWSEVVLYRRAAVDGPMTVMLGLAGYGEAHIDDLRIEPLVALPGQPSESGGDGGGGANLAETAPLPAPNPGAAEAAAAAPRPRSSTGRRPSASSRGVRVIR